MGFLKDYFTNVFHERETARTTNSFERVSEDILQRHLEVNRYGSFTLTDAVRPSFDLKVVPSEGYKHDQYEDDQGRGNIPVLMTAISRERLFEVFMDLLDPLGNTVDVVLETSHGSQGSSHRDLYREHLDMPVLKSLLWDHEDLLTNDGCCGIAILNPQVPHEIQFDEHKLLIVYSHALDEFQDILDRHDIPRNEQMRFITEAEHVHSSSQHYLEQFEILRTQLGMDIDY